MIASETGKGRNFNVRLSAFASAQPAASLPLPGAHPGWLLCQDFQPSLAARLKIRGRRQPLQLVRRQLTHGNSPPRRQSLGQLADGFSELFGDPVAFAVACHFCCPLSLGTAASIPRLHPTRSRLPPHIPLHFPALSHGSTCTSTSATQSSCSRIANRTWVAASCDSRTVIAGSTSMWRST